MIDQSQSGENTESDLLKGADVGETVTVTRSKTLHTINYTPSEFYGTDRVADVEIADIEVLDGDGASKDIRITWEGEVMKTLPRRWPPVPRTQPEQRRGRLPRCVNRLGRGIVFVLPFGVATAVSWLAVNRLAGRMTINGQPVTVPTLPEFLGMVGAMMAISALAMFAVKQAPGKVRAGPRGGL